ncbi:DegT/DnrJ/EryC1/StrS family aminotransferase [Patescibacteria group bacterium]
MTDINKHINAIKTDENRNLDFIHLTANENQISDTARLFLGSKISDRYFMGGGDKNNIINMHPFTALGIKSVEELIKEAEEAAKEMLYAEAVNLNVLSGVHAMMSAILSVTDPEDLVLTVPVAYGGHFATEGILSRVGRKHAFVEYDLKNLRFDTQKTADLVKRLNVSAIYLDVSYYLNPHNLKELREAVGEEITIIYDASHTMGLIMGQEFQAPLKEGANVTCANTHKTLPGPHKGMIAFRDKELAKKANTIIDGCLYSTPHITHLIALSITILEMKAFGREYAKQIIRNSRVMAKKFSKLSYEVRRANNGEFSNNHQVHVFIDDKGDSSLLYANLIKNNISTNFDAPLGNRSFIRVGTQELTRRNLKEKDVTYLVELIHKAMLGNDVKNEIIEFNNSFREIGYSFDKDLKA